MASVSVFSHLFLRLHSPQPVHGLKKTGYSCFGYQCFGFRTCILFTGRVKDLCYQGLRSLKTAKVVEGKFEQLFSFADSRDVVIIGV